MGAGLPGRFNGMFAFAIWDKTRRTCCWPGTAMASSRSTTCFKAYPALRLRTESHSHPPGRPAHLDPEALLEYFTFQNIFTDKTLLKGISYFPPAAGPGCPWPATGRLNLTSYWDFSFSEPEHPATEATNILEELDRLSGRR